MNLDAKAGVSFNKLIFVVDFLFWKTGTSVKARKIRFGMNATLLKVDRDQWESTPLH